MDLILGIAVIVVAYLLTIFLFFRSLDIIKTIDHHKLVETRKILKFLRRKNRKEDL
jgi:hypothetical protein